MFNHLECKDEFIKAIIVGRQGKKQKKMMKNNIQEPIIEEYKSEQL